MKNEAEIPLWFNEKERKRIRKLAKIIFNKNKPKIKCGWDKWEEISFDELLPVARQEYIDHLTDAFFAPEFMAYAKEIIARENNGI